MAPQNSSLKQKTSILPPPPPPPPPPSRQTPSPNVKKSGDMKRTRVSTTPPLPPSRGENVMLFSSPTHQAAHFPSPLALPPSGSVSVHTASSSQSSPPATPSTIPSIAPISRAPQIGEEGDVAPWNLRDGYVIPSLSHTLALSAHLASLHFDDRVIRFRFATSSEEVTLHRSRLLFVSGPLAALVRRPFTDINNGFVTLSPKDTPQVFRHIRQFLYGLPLILTKLSLPQLIDLALSANRWQLDDLFLPTLLYVCRLPLSDPASLLPSAKLLFIDKTPAQVRSHVRTQLSNYISASLQSTFPNAPSADTTSLLQTFHDVNDLALPLSLAAQQAPFLPLLHGVIAALETRLDDAKLGMYIRALPVASAGVSRLLSCDAATARWPARAVRIAVAVASAAAHDVARAAIPLCVDTSSSIVVLSGVSLSISATRDVKGIEVKVSLRRESDSESHQRDWSFFRVGIRGAECPCTCGGIINGGGDVVLENGNASSTRGIVRFRGEEVDQWIEGHDGCEEMMLSIEIELLRGNATVFVTSNELRHQSPEPKTPRKEEDNHAQGPTLSEGGTRLESGDTSDATSKSEDRQASRRNTDDAWHVGL